MEFAIKKGIIGMQKKITLIAFCFSIIIAFDSFLVKNNPVRAEYKEYQYKIDFGKARPVESLILNRNLSVKTNSEEDWVKVEFDSSLSNQNGEYIPINRISLDLNNRHFQLDKGPFKIDSKKILFTDKLLFIFSLNLTPADHPGIYQGSIRIHTSLKTITFQLEVEVQPWVRMETDQRLINLNQVTKEDVKLQSPMPLTIRVASNTQWVLSANLVQDTKTPLWIQLSRWREYDIQNLIRWGELLEMGKKPLAAGNATVSRSESYWTELSMAVYIEDFIKYPAGEGLFQIRFLLEIWDQKTVKL
jgi:hypothetical protein